MSFPNPGPIAVLDEVLREGEKINFSIFGQDEGVLKRLVEIARNHSAYSLINAIEVNVSCPNIHAGENCSTNDLKRIALVHKESG